MKHLLLKAIELKKQCAEYARDLPSVVEIENQMDVLLSEPLEKNKTCTFQKAMQENRGSVYSFLYYAEVPPDNPEIGSSERAIRTITVKQKVYGQFKTGQQAFCILRSVMDTCIKKNVDVFDILYN